MRKTQRKRPGTSRRRPEGAPTPPLQAMGGKEERVSRVGQARAEAERHEKEGEVSFEIAPGPDSDELLHGRRRPRPRVQDRLPLKKVSPRPRGGPVGLEPEDISH